MSTILEIKDNIEMVVETISGIISATGTKKQKDNLEILKEKLSMLFDVTGDEYIKEAHETMSIIVDPEFNLDFVAEEVNTLKLNITSLSNLKLKEALDGAKEILEKNNIKTENDANGADEEEIVAELEDDANVEKEEIKIKEEKMKTNKTNEETKTKETKGEEMKKETKTEKTIRELKEKLAKAKEKADKCDTSTLKKVGKVTLGIGLLAGAAAAGYYAAKKYSGNTTIILNGNDEE